MSAGILIHAPRKGSDSSKSDRRKSPRYFYPRSPQGERQGRACAKIKAYKFLSTFPARGATSSITEMVPSSLSFLPTLPARGATENGHKGGRPRKFLSTLPARGATELASSLAQQKRFLSTLPARGATHKARIHVLCKSEFLSTLPARGATCTWEDRDTAVSFLSTLPARGATPAGAIRNHATRYFYPRSPRGERRADQGGQVFVFPISIHAPREGSDGVAFQGHFLDGVFLSTLPARGATSTASSTPACSAHFYPRSPRGERRHQHRQHREFCTDFYPRSPRGERPTRMWHTT